MGFDCGFDIFPNTYDEERRREDGKVLQLPGDRGIFLSKHYIQLMVGECPKMPANPDLCDYFLRFSSKVSGGLT
ncbi:hypothetical protein QBC46DRAFT_346097 [Diplogelasinospora grovesii]|uniref:Uncharacterized protein n=1 Tax=Diplogelasinospora grovesii TaxID=303347 RepID=A0AAN6N077_9PEZI|nr:hypothetical protein QBC46DRAFT_346097 [Diplogelasinospora grovesii]